MGPDIPALISSPVAVLCRLSNVSVADTEANLRLVILARVLVANLCPEGTDLVVREPGLVVDASLGVAARTIDLDVNNGVHISGDNFRVIRSHGVNDQANILVPIDLIRHHIVKQGCVAQVVINLALRLIFLRAKRLSRLSRVRDFDGELEVLLLAVGKIRRVDCFGEVIDAEEVGDGGHLVGQLAKCGGRLDLIVD